MIKHWDTIKRVVSSGAEAVGRYARMGGEKIKSAFQTAMNWVRSNWPLLLAILTGPFGLAALAIIRHRDSIMRTLKAVPGKIRSAFSTVASAITGPFRNGFAGIKSAWNNTVGGKGFTVPSWIPGVGGKSFKIPKLHTGGMFKVAGGGKREGLALLQNGEGVISRDNMRALARSKTGNGNQAGAGKVVFRSDGTRIGDVVLELVRQAIRNRGGNVVKVLA